MATAVASLVDEDFQQVTKELSNPDLKGYEQILHTHGLDIYRRFIEVHLIQLLTVVNLL